MELLESRRLLAAGIFQESGDFLSEVDRLRLLAIQKDTNDYVRPTNAQRAKFHDAATSLIAGDIHVAADKADKFGYEVVRFADSGTDTILYGLRESLVNGETKRGWGSYFVNLGFQSNSLVEVPQPVFDTFSPEIGASAFLSSTSRGFLMAGAHRNANGPGTADVAHLSKSIFQSVHEAWNQPPLETVVFQIHGFSILNHDGDPGEAHFPAGTDVVISAGDGTVNDTLVDLDAQFEGQGFQSYAYNTLASNAPVNILINDGVNGNDFLSLAGTTNVQGNFSLQHGGRFIHIELEQSLRFDSQNRQTSSGLISNIIAAEPDQFVTAAEYDPTNNSITVDFSNPVEVLTVSLDNLTVGDDAIADSAEILDADSIRFALPTMAGGPHKITLKNVEDTNGVSTNVFHRWIEVVNADHTASFLVVDGGRDDTFTFDSNGSGVGEFELARGNSAARGATSESGGQYLWVVDNDDFVYVYDTSGSLLGQWHADGLRRPEGVATDGTDIWIVDRGQDAIFRFANGATWRGGSYSPTSQIDLDENNKNAIGITTDGSSLWVVDSQATDRVFKYSIGGESLGEWTIDSRNRSPRGITVDPTDSSSLWIVDSRTDEAFLYTSGALRTQGEQDANLVFAEAGKGAQGIAAPPQIIGAMTSPQEPGNDHRNAAFQLVFPAFPATTSPLSLDEETDDWLIL